MNLLRSGSLDYVSLLVDVMTTAQHLLRNSILRFIDTLIFSEVLLELAKNSINARNYNTRIGPLKAGDCEH